MIEIFEGSNYPLQPLSGGCCGAGSCVCPCSCQSIDAHKNGACSSWSGQFYEMWGQVVYMC